MMALGFQTLGDLFLALGLTLPRIIGAFIMLPLITQSNMPAMVRNSFLVSLRWWRCPLPLRRLWPVAWPMMVLGEPFIGAIGYLFGLVFGRFPPRAR